MAPLAEDWQKEKVKKEHEVLNFNWHRKSPLPEVIAEVELNKIVGTTHDSYNESNWLQLLAGLPKRSPDDAYVAMVRDNMDHTKGDQPITLHQYGAEYIIYEGGNHRICHAKFAGLPSIRVWVEKFVLDPALMSSQSPAAPPLMPAVEHRTWLPGWARRRWPG